jgi:hypothetical protein
MGAHLAREQFPELITFVCFDAPMLYAYRDALGAKAKEGSLLPEPPSPDYDAEPAGIATRMLAAPLAEGGLSSTYQACAVILI